jgi:hypothetical protein
MNPKHLLTTSMKTNGLVPECSKMRLLAGGTDSHEVIGPRLSEQRSAVALRTTSGWRLGGSAVKEVDHVRVWQGRNSRTGPPLSHRNTDAPNFALFEGGDQLPGTTLVSHPQDGHNYDDGGLNLRRHYGSGKPTITARKSRSAKCLCTPPFEPREGWGIRVCRTLRDQ